MENKTWLGRVFASIASLFMKNYESWLKKLWNNIAEDLKPDLVQVVDWIENMKTTYLDSPIMDAIVLAFPGEKDDKALAWVRSLASKLVKELRLEKVTVQELNKTDKQSIATRLTEEVTGLPFDQASTTIKTAYWNTAKLKDNA